MNAPSQDMEKQFGTGPLAEKRLNSSFFGVKNDKGSSDNLSKSHFQIWLYEVRIRGLSHRTLIIIWHVYTHTKL